MATLTKRPKTRSQPKDKISTRQNPDSTVSSAAPQTWDDMLLSDDSQALLSMMGDEAEREYRTGKTRKGGWGD